MVDLLSYFTRALQSTSEIVQLGLIIALTLVVIRIFKLARSSTVDENGKVIVRYYPPTQWLSRYNSHVSEQRAQYSPRQKKLLLWMQKGKTITEALASLLLALLLMAMGVFLLIYDPESRYAFYPWMLVGSGVFFLAIAVWVFSKR